MDDLRTLQAALSTNDSGDVRFDYSVAAGTVTVTIRPPLGLESSKVSVTMSMIDFLDNAAKMTLDLNASWRAMLARAAAAGGRARA
jgi:hypothetical protein